MDHFPDGIVSVPAIPLIFKPEDRIFTSTDVSDSPTNPILVALREIEADPHRWCADLQAFVAGDFFPFAEHVLDDVLTENDLQPSSPEVLHAIDVLGRLEG